MCSVYSFAVIIRGPISVRTDIINKQCSGKQQQQPDSESPHTLSKNTHNQSVSKILWFSILTEQTLKYCGIKGHGGCNSPLNCSEEKNILVFHMWSFIHASFMMQQHHLLHMPYSHYLSKQRLLLDMSLTVTAHIKRGEIQKPSSTEH